MSGIVFTEDHGIESLNAYNLRLELANLRAINDKLVKALEACDNLLGDAINNCTIRAVFGDSTFQTLDKAREALTAAKEASK